MLGRGCGIGMFRNLLYLFLRSLPCFEVLGQYDSDWIAAAYLKKIGSYLLTPVSVASSHIDCHLPEVRDLLALETIEIRLNRRTRVLQVLRRQMKGILKLRATATPLEKHR